ncbi:MAG TPA: 5'-nucleotidase C-terminal domain-containing protein, partial [Blastocatellia bacterium]|nr:5'-nucleotidase C-terminal domain-containing protein [Blastocatellia bacterium]
DSVVLECSLSGRQLLALLEASLKLMPESTSAQDGNGEFLQISGIRVAGRPGKLLSAESVTRSNSPIDARKTYRVATIDYVWTKSKSYSPLVAGLEPRGCLKDLRGLVQSLLPTALQTLEEAPDLREGMHGWVRSS